MCSPFQFFKTKPDSLARLTQFSVDTLTSIPLLLNFEPRHLIKLRSALFLVFCCSQLKRMLPRRLGQNTNLTKQKDQEYISEAFI